jgi:hypothetical protein
MSSLMVALLKIPKTIKETITEYLNLVSKSQKKGTQNCLLSQRPHRTNYCSRDPTLKIYSVTFPEYSYDTQILRLKIY